jgi:hypothetical protein
MRCMLGVEVTVLSLPYLGGLEVYVLAVVLCIVDQSINRLSCRASRVVAAIRLPKASRNSQ